MAKVAVKKAATKKKATKKVAKVKKAIKKMITTLPEVRKDVKPYKVLRMGSREVRIYPPAKRTIMAWDGSMHFLQLPYMILGFYPYKTGGFLFGCFSTEDLSQLSEAELTEAKVYMMPFPYQLDNGPWGPCCLIHYSPYYYFQGDFDKLITQFFQTSFRGFGDYGQKPVTCWSEMKFEQVCEMMHKAPPFYAAPFKTFLEALDDDRLQKQY